MVVALLNSMWNLTVLGERNQHQVERLIKTQQLLTGDIEIVETALSPAGIPLLLLQYSTFEDSSALQTAIEQSDAALAALTRIETLASNPVQTLTIGMIRDELEPLSRLAPPAGEERIDLSRELPLHNPSQQEHVNTALTALRAYSNLVAETLQESIALNNQASRTETERVWLAGSALVLSLSYLITVLVQLQREATRGLLAAETQLITEQRLREQEHLYAVLIEALPVPVLTIDERGTIEAINPATTALFGYSRDELVGHKVNRLMPMHEAKAHDSYLDNYKRTSVRKIIGIGRGVQALCKDGTEINVHLSVTEFESEGKRHFAGIIVDLSEITAKQAALEEALVQLQAATEAKDRFLATASHEIRTPLTGMFGMIHILADTELEPEQRKLLNTLDSSGRQLMVILNDILDAAKLRQGGIELFPQPINVADLLEQVSGTFNTLAKNKGLSFTIIASEDLRAQWLCVDAVRLTQILSNLCGNAVKFTQEGKVELEVELQSRNEERLNLEFIVRDTGYGIPEAQIDNITKPFTQVDMALNRSGTGTGLGLSIVTALLDLMGSQLSIRSTEGEGSEFSFTLDVPLADEPIKEASSALVQDDAPLWTSRPRILVAEDNMVNRMVIENLLQKLPLDYDLVENGRELLEQAQKEAYQLIISDIQMPEMDGLEATVRLRAIPELDSVPIIALTAAAFEDEISRMRDVGFDDYVPKPIDRQKLVDVLGKHLS